MALTPQTKYEAIEGKPSVDLESGLGDDVSEQKYYSSQLAKMGGPLL